MATTQPEIDQATHWRVSQFLLEETSLLDRREIATWIELLTDDFRYEIPVPITPDNPGRTPWMEGAFLVEETRDSLANLWAKRLEPKFVEYAWGENPPQRVRRFVTGVRITPEPQAEADTFRVDANVLLTYARQSDPVVLLPAGRVDLVRVDDGGTPRLARRTVHLDATVVTTTHLRLLF
jgi:phthalate 3,4-dioxygenase subunit beta